MTDDAVVREDGPFRTEALARRFDHLVIPPAPNRMPLRIAAVLVCMVAPAALFVASRVHVGEFTQGYAQVVGGRVVAAFDSPTSVHVGDRLRLHPANGQSMEVRVIEVDRGDDAEATLRRVGGQLSNLYRSPLVVEAESRADIPLRGVVRASVDSTSTVIDVIISFVT